MEEEGYVAACACVKCDGIAFEGRLHLSPIISGQRRHDRQMMEDQGKESKHDVTKFS